VNTLNYETTGCACVFANISRSSVLFVVTLIIFAVHFHRMRNNKVPYRPKDPKTQMANASQTSNGNFSKQETYPMQAQV
jgi:hypothetical protein